MIGSEKITFSPVFIARSSLRMISAGMPRAIIAPAMISHSDRAAPGVMPPLTIAQRKYPARHSRQASPTRVSTSSRVPNTNRRSADRSGVSIRCCELMAAISASVGFRGPRSITAARLKSGMYTTMPCARAARSHISFHVIRMCARKCRLRRVKAKSPRLVVVGGLWPSSTLTDCDRCQLRLKSRTCTLAPPALAFTGRLGYTSMIANEHPKKDPG